MVGASMKFVPTPAALPTPAPPPIVKSPSRKPIQRSDSLISEEVVLSPGMESATASRGTGLASLVEEEMLAEEEELAPSPREPMVDASKPKIQISSNVLPKKEANSDKKESDSNLKGSSNKILKAEEDPYLKDAAHILAEADALVDGHIAHSSTFKSYNVGNSESAASLLENILADATIPSHPPPPDDDPIPPPDEPKSTLTPKATVGINVRSFSVKAPLATSPGGPRSPSTFGANLKAKAPNSSPGDAPDKGPKRIAEDTPKEKTSDAEPKNRPGDDSLTKKVDFRAKLGLFGTVPTKENIASPSAKEKKPQDTFLDREELQALSEALESAEESEKDEKPRSPHEDVAEEPPKVEVLPPTPVTTASALPPPKSPREGVSSVRPSVMSRPVPQSSLLLRNASASNNPPSSPAKVAPAQEVKRAVLTTKKSHSDPMEKKVEEAEAVPKKPTPILSKNVSSASPTAASTTRRPTMKAAVTLEVAPPASPPPVSPSSSPRKLVQSATEHREKVESPKTSPRKLAAPSSPRSPDVPLPVEPKNVDALPVSTRKPPPPASSAAQPSAGGSGGQSPTSPRGAFGRSPNRVAATTHFGKGEHQSPVLSSPGAAGPKAVPPIVPPIGAAPAPGITHFLFLYL